MFVASVGVVLFGAVLSAYYSTLFPSIPGGDSGELVAEACHLGVAHPPGYPLFILLGHLAIKLPLPESWLASPTPAYRVNLMNATFGGLTALVMFHCVIRMCKLLAGSRSSDEWPFINLAAAAGILSAACYSFGPLQWLYAVGAEVFALNNFAAAVLIWLTIRYAEHPTHTNVLIGAFFSGIAMTNQHTIVLFEIPIIVWVLATRRKVLTLVEVLQCAGCFFLGMTPYVYLIVSDTFFPQPMSWGDCSTLTGFLKHFVRADYGTFRLYAQDVNSAGVWDRIRMYAENFGSIQVPASIAAPGVFIGLAVLLWTCFSTLFTSVAQHKGQSSRSVGRKSEQAVAEGRIAVSTSSWPGALVGTWLFYLVVFHYLSNMPMDDPLLYGVHARFWMQPNVVTCLFIGVAVWFAVDKLFQVTKLGGKNVATYLSFGILMLSAGSAAWLESRSHEISDQSGNWYLTNYSKALMSVVPQNSILITAFDQQWTTVRYLHECEGYRSDLEVFNAPMLSFGWFERQRPLFPRVKFPGKFLLPENRQAGMGTFTIASFVEANLNNPQLPGGVYWAGTLLYDNEKKFAATFEMEQHGLISKMVPKRAGLAPLEDMLAVEADWDKAVATLGPLPNITIYNYETWEWTVHEDYWVQAENRATQLLDWAVNHVCPDGNLNATMLLQACYLLEGSFAHKKFAKSASTYKNLGLAHVRLVQHKGDWPDNVPLPKIPGLAEDATVNEWKSQSAMRVLELWSKFLEMPGSTQDPSYHNVLDVVNILRRAAGGQAIPNANNTPKVKSATKKTKTKK